MYMGNKKLPHMKVLDDIAKAHNVKYFWKNVGRVCMIRGAKSDVAAAEAAFRVAIRDFQSSILCSSHHIYYIFTPEVSTSKLTRSWQKRINIFCKL